MSPSTSPSETINNNTCAENNIHPYLSPSSYALLKKARETTKRRPFSQKFDSATFRNKLSAACEAQLSYKPRPWQLDVAEALYLKVDTVAIAGTGAGKTLPFALIHLIIPNLVTIVVSPLNVLEADQVREFSFYWYEWADQNQMLG